MVPIKKPKVFTISPDKLKGAPQYIISLSKSGYAFVILIYGELVAEYFDFCFDVVFDVCVAVFAVSGEAVDHLDDPVTDLAELCFSKAAGCGGGGAESNA